MTRDIRRFFNMFLCCADWMQRHVACVGIRGFAELMTFQVWQKRMQFFFKTFWTWQICRISVKYFWRGFSTIDTLMWNLHKVIAWKLAIVDTKIAWCTNLGEENCWLFCKSEYNNECQENSPLDKSTWFTRFTRVATEQQKTVGTKSWFAKW